MFFICSQRSGEGTQLCSASARENDDVTPPVFRVAVALDKSDCFEFVEQNDEPGGIHPERVSELVLRQRSITQFQHRAQMDGSQTGRLRDGIERSDDGISKLSDQAAQSIVATLGAGHGFA